jgi:hypothetical protein
MGIVISGSGDGLDTLGMLRGVSRPRGMDDIQYRKLILEVAYGGQCNTEEDKQE